MCLRKHLGHHECNCSYAYILLWHWRIPLVVTPESGIEIHNLHDVNMTTHQLYCFAVNVGLTKWQRQFLSQPGQLTTGGKTHHHCPPLQHIHQIRTSMVLDLLQASTSTSKMVLTSRHLFGQACEASQVHCKNVGNWSNMLPPHRLYTAPYCSCTFFTLHKDSLSENVYNWHFKRTQDVWGSHHACN